MGVFDGVRTFGNGNEVVAEAGTKSCSIIACTNEKDLQSCAQR